MIYAVLTIAVLWLTTGLAASIKGHRRYIAMRLATQEYDEVVRAQGTISLMIVTLLVIFWPMGIFFLRRRA